MSHRLRREITNALFLRNASAAEIAEELGQPVGKVRYLLRAMAEEGSVSLVGGRERRGAVERVYSGGDFVIDLAEFAALPIAVKDEINAAIVRLSISDVVTAQRGGTFNRRDDSAFVRFPLLVDEQGWEELAELHRELIDRVTRVRDECQERLKIDDAQATLVVSVNLLFEMPDP